jgi:hypothetical protein
MPRTLEEIQAGAEMSRTLCGLVSVLDAKLALRSRYALLEYEAALEGRDESSELFRSLQVSESVQIERVLETLTDATARGGFGVGS